LPALIALKGIMMLASGGKAIASLVTAMSIIAGKNTTGVPPVVSGLATNPLVIAAASSQVATLAASTEAERVTNIEAAKKGMQFNIVAATFTGSMALPRLTNGYPGDILGLKGNRPTTVNINVQGADPKATVDALGKYLKQNGSLPFNVTNPPTRKIG
jgi:hypothetical protein